MNSTRHSFIDIFDSSFNDGQDSKTIKKIIIPIIQRDYAQGRRDPGIDRIRGKFLDALYDAVIGTPVTLDFIYGDVDENGVMTPLDGQQRLTTLFLLHWYAAKKAGISGEETAFLAKFGYETRYSARDFCEKLMSVEPSFTGLLSEEIKNQAWFPLDWQKDPTISSMLVMLDAINEKFEAVDDLWKKLKAGAITFYFLPIKDMGLTDELYIKMNSRGKPLTRFEHFKAEFERCIRMTDETASERVIRKIDIDWTDMLWRYRDSGNGGADDEVIDDEFLRYFRFICDVICYQDGDSPQEKSAVEFDLLTEYFTGDRERVLKNIATLESFFDCWCKIDGFKSPSEFLDSCMSHEHDPQKVIVYDRNIDILEDCLHAYGDMSGRQRLFPLNRFVLLYAVTCFLRNRENITDHDFIRRLRTVNNLIQNSEYEIADRTDNNRFPAILRQTESIILSGEINDTIRISFNANQIAEEKEKQAYLREHPRKARQLFRLEDHPLLKGSVSIIGLANINYADRFASLFDCDWDLINCALMSIGDYGQLERNMWRWQYGTKEKEMPSAWVALFHRSSNSGFENTRDILLKLLSKAAEFTDRELRRIKDGFIKDCKNNKRFPWRYYYVKYDAFRPGSYGKYSNGSSKTTPYMFCAMQTEYAWSPKTYMPYLKAADEAHLSKDWVWYGTRLVYGEQYIVCENDHYELKNTDTDELIKKKYIPQDENGIDMKDRISLLKQFIKRIG